jgi:hypothetical protein
MQLKVLKNPRQVLDAENLKQYSTVFQTETVTLHRRQKYLMKILVTFNYSTILGHNILKHYRALRSSESSVTFNPSF